MSNLEDYLDKAMNARQVGTDIESLFTGNYLKRIFNKFIGRKVASKLFIKKLPHED